MSFLHFAVLTKNPIALELSKDYSVKIVQDQGFALPDSPFDNKLWNDKNIKHNKQMNFISFANLFINRKASKEWPTQQMSAQRSQMSRYFATF